MDKILGGGWDQASLNVLMGETNVGKCFFDAIVKIKNIKTGIIEDITIEKLYEKIIQNI
jgi:hypothetical protein